MVDVHIDDIPDNSVLTKLTFLCQHEDECPMLSIGHGECIIEKYILERWVAWESGLLDHKTH